MTTTARVGTPSERALGPTSFGLIIDGVESVPASGDTLTRHSPATGELVSVCANGDRSDMQAAIAAARAAFDDGRWRNLTDVQRMRTLHRVAAAVQAHKDDLAELLTAETGKPLMHSRGEVDTFVEATEFAAGAVMQISGDAITNSAPDGLGFVSREPVGVVGAITPYNAPLWTLAPKLIFALAAGCSVVLKPSPLTSGITVAVTRLLAEAGLPPGVVNVVTTESIDAARQLTEHRDIDKVSFTGSDRVGAEIAAAAASRMKRITMELGGKSPNILFADCDMVRAVADFSGSIFANTGQVCTAGSRILVQDEIHDEVVDRLVEVARAEVLGDPRDPAVTMGPLIGAEQLERVEAMVQAACEDGARLRYGGRRASTPLGGFYFEPTVLDRVDPSMRIAREEVFGPVAAVMSFTTEEDALRMANDSVYGLKAAVWTRDASRMMRFVRDLRAGSVMGNTWPKSVSQARMPFGGFGRSGVGREFGLDGLVESYTEPKAVFLRF